MIHKIALRYFNLYIPIMLMPFLCANLAFSAPLVFDGPVDFGEVEIGSSKKLKITLQNKSRRTIYLANQWLRNGDSFSLEEGTCVMDGQSLKAMRSCTLYITFYPEDEDLNTANLTIGYFNNTGRKWLKSSVPVQGSGSYNRPPEIELDDY